MWPNTACEGRKSLAWSTDQNILSGPLVLRVFFFPSHTDESQAMVRLLCIYMEEEIQF